jgi:hypothetical protein
LSWLSHVAADRLRQSNASVRELLDRIILFRCVGCLGGFHFCRHDRLNSGIRISSRTYGHIGAAQGKDADHRPSLRGRAAGIGSGETLYRAPTDAVGPNRGGSPDVIAWRDGSIANAVFVESKVKDQGLAGSGAVVPRS